METSVLATREVGLVIIDSGSTTSAGGHRLIITIKPVVIRVEDMVGAEIGSLVTSDGNRVC